MDPISTLTATYTGIRTAVSTIKTAIEAKYQIGADKQILEAFEQLGKAQDVMFAMRDTLANLQQENHEFKEKIRQIEISSSRVSQYELAQSEGTDFAWRSKTSPPHWACPACFENGKIMVMQPWDQQDGRHRCSGCGKLFYLGERHPEPPKPRRSNPYG